MTRLSQVVNPSKCCVTPSPTHCWHGVVLPCLPIKYLKNGHAITSSGLKNMTENCTHVKSTLKTGTFRTKFRADEQKYHHVSALTRAYLNCRLTSSSSGQCLSSLDQSEVETKAGKWALIMTKVAMFLLHQPGLKRRSTDGQPIVARETDTKHSKQPSLKIPPNNKHKRICFQLISWDVT